MLNAPSGAAADQVAAGADLVGAVVERPEATRPRPGHRQAERRQRRHLVQRDLRALPRRVGTDVLTRRRTAGGRRRSASPRAPDPGRPGRGRCRCRWRCHRRSPRPARSRRSRSWSAGTGRSCRSAPGRRPACPRRGCRCRTSACRPRTDCGTARCTGTVYTSNRSAPNSARIGLVTLSSSAIGNCIGLNGSSCGDDSQVPGIDITSTSGQLASWNSGRGFDVGRHPRGRHRRWGHRRRRDVGPAQHHDHDRHDQHHDEAHRACGEQRQKAVAFPPVGRPVGRPIGLGHASGTPVLHECAGCAPAQQSRSVAMRM